MAVEKAVETTTKDDVMMEKKWLQDTYAPDREHITSQN